MRWTYIIPRMLIVGLLWCFLTFGLDPLLRYSTVQSLQVAIGAKADVGEFRTQVYPPRLTVAQVALANARRPGTNLMQFDELEFRLAGDPLLRRQFVVEEGRITGVRFKGIRTDDGLLEPAPPEDADAPPSWLTEKLKTAGDEWLTRLTEQAKAQIDPNILETYRVGSDLYAKWDGRFNEMADRGKLLKPQVVSLKSQFQNAKQGDTIQKIEQYLQVAQKAELLVQEARQIKDQLTAIVPEVRTDFARLDQARKNDQELVRHKISLLKPDGRRISETLIGEQMYLQLQQLLSWVEMVREYQRELKEQTQPERGNGTDFQFPILNPTPDFHIRRLLVAGEIEIDGEQVPFEAEINDITEDAPLLGRPCIVRFRARGPKPVVVALSYDTRTEKTITKVLVDYQDAGGRILSAGKPDNVLLSARLADISWNLKITLIEDLLQGRIQFDSELQDVAFSARDSIRPEFVQAARDALSGIRAVNAGLTLGGTVRKPQFELDSNLGTQIADGVELALVNQIENAKTRLIAEVNTYASDQVTKLSARFASEYEELKAENADLIAQIQQVQQIVASLQSGKVDPNAVFRQVTESKVLSDKQQGKVDRAMDSMNRVLGTPGNSGAPGLGFPIAPGSGLPVFEGFRRN